ncbi:hypothetical protein [Ralstonia solanacearum]|uniref:hypothetical protein n=1 Tax=Ralstonia solanacearum TaxID=305 RepID=UPI0018D07461|nr:hypothetical protein [Ralstonia solanacearum]
MAKVVLALLVVAAAVFYILFKAPQGGQVNASTPAPAMPAPVALPAASAGTPPASGAAASAPSATSAPVAEVPASAAQP